MVVKWFICDEDFRQNVIFAYSGSSKVLLEFRFREVLASVRTKLT